MRTVPSDDPGGVAEVRVTIGQLTGVVFGPVAVDGVIMGEAELLAYAAKQVEEEKRASEVRRGEKRRCE